jgi:3-methyladenine DNA glycosylase AlkD
MYQKVITHLKSLADADIAEHSQRFFKTGPGEYGEGDIFLGIRVPVLRQQIKHFKDISLDDAEKLLHSPYHEVRLFILLVLVKQFEKGMVSQQEAIYELYMRSAKYINNWDLVDSSAPYISGPWLFNHERSILYKFVKSPLLWERRIAVLSSFYFIKQNDFADTLALCEALLDDPEDLMHKASGWMLRELGKRDEELMEGFLLQHYSKMPRTMLRYAIEKLTPERRKQYLEGVL